MLGSVSGIVRTWDPQRLIHRQTYIDLIRAYLIDYGSQRDLSRALGLSEAYTSYLLTPAGLSARQHDASWSVIMESIGPDAAEAFKFLKTPSQDRAHQIARLLCTDADRRDVLLQHISLARHASRPTAVTNAMISGAEAAEAISTLGDLHQEALHAGEATQTANAYARIWENGHRLPAVIDPGIAPAAFAQALLFLHDTAQVLNRPDLALGFARNAIRALAARQSHLRNTDDLTRLRVNAALAEVVTLNTLGLRQDAALAAAHAETLPDYGLEPESWQRSFLEQKLTAAIGSARASIYQAEATADSALTITAGNPVLQTGIKRRMMDVYIARPSGRSQRKASHLEQDLQNAARDDSLSPLRRAQILRTLISNARVRHDHKSAASLVTECLCLTTDAQLIHQRHELIRQLTRSTTHTPQ